MNPHSDLATVTSSQLVPAAFAEKAMASLMQLHSELMDEKERRVDLFRRLMEKEQALAELKMYVKLLEDKVTPAPSPMPAPPPAAAAPQQAERPPHPPPPAVPSVARSAPAVRAPRVEGWKTW
jgi:hypothetical protein